MVVGVGLRRTGPLLTGLSLIATIALAYSPAMGIAQTRVDIVSDVRYATHAGIDLLLDVYVPPGEGPFPAVVVIPGGKWVNIDKTKHADVPMYFAEHGIAAFAISYRSALEFPYPAALEDVTTAVRWVRGHASSYQVDPSRLGAVGASSGGHLAALIGMMGSGPTDRGARVNAVLSWSGMTDLRPLVTSPDDELREAVLVFLGCSARVECTDVARQASPITYVDPTDPPMYLVNGDEEIIPVDQAERMGQALTGAGVEAEIDIVRGGHGVGYGGGDKVLDTVIPYARAWIEGRDAPLEEGPDDTESTDGKGQAAEASGPSSEGKPGGVVPNDEAGVAASSLDAVVVAIALIASILVVVLLISVFGLRRRIASMSGRGSSQSIEAGGR